MKDVKNTLMAAAFMAAMASSGGGQEPTTPRLKAPLHGLEEVECQDVHLQVAAVSRSQDRPTGITSRKANPTRQHAETWK